jgi:hypothetical protein
LERGQVNDPVLDSIKRSVVGILGRSFDAVAIADGPEMAVINAFPEGKTIEVRITIKEDK